MTFLQKLENFKFAITNYFVRLKIKYSKNINKITQNSKNIEHGDCFICIKGAKFDGHDFTLQAIKQNASFVIFTDIAQYHNFKKANKNISNKLLFYNINNQNDIVKLLNTKYKKKPLMIGITGTNGKTSTVHFCIEILKLQNIKSASIGTLGTITNFNHDASFQNTDLTTPDIVSLYHNLNTLHSLGTKYCFIEVTSIALKTNRVQGLKFISTAFLNFTQDHLDFHKTMDDYFESKMILFKKHLYFKSSSIVLNYEDKMINDVLQSIHHRYYKNITFFHDILYKSSTQNDIYKNANKIIFTYYINKIDFIKKNNKITILGDYAMFQAYNISTAIGLIDSIDNNFFDNLNKDIILSSPKGRMESIENTIDAKIFVDFAHTPDGLEKALTQCKRIKEGLLQNDKKSRIVCVFGCGGDRDSKKRPQMATIAAKFCDFVIVTSDNPRTEDPIKIINEIEIGFREVLYDSYKLIVKRQDAIKYVIENTQQNDIVLIAGKGHEEYEIIGTNKYYYSDAEEIRKNLNKI